MQQEDLVSPELLTLLLEKNFLEWNLKLSFRIEYKFKIK